MTSTPVFTPSSQFLKPTRTASLELFHLKALIDDQILAWSNLLPSDSPSVSVVNSPLVWSPDKHDVPLLKPAIPKLNHHSPFLDAKSFLSLVEENLKEDALNDWEPFSRKDDVDRASIVSETSSDDSVVKGRLAIPPPSNLLLLQTNTPNTTYNKLLDERTRLSTPHDWKPLHPLLDPSSPFCEWTSSQNLGPGDSRKPFNKFALDDCLISQGDAARSRRKGGRQKRGQVPEIPAELIARRDTVQLVNLLKSRTARLFGNESEGSPSE